MHKLLTLTFMTFLLGCVAGPGIALGQTSSSNVNIVFAVDVSGSMEGHKMKQTRDALQRAVDLLPDNSNVGLLTFDTSTRWDYSISTLNRRVISSVIRRISARGGTNIGDAMLAASEALEQHKTSFRGDKSSAKFQIVLMSDGQNTGGESPERAIPRVVRRGQRLDVIGIEMNARRFHAALSANGLEKNYHTTDRVEQLFATLKRVLNLEKVNVNAQTGESDLTLLTNVPTDVLRAALAAVVMGAKNPKRANSSGTPGTVHSPLGATGGSGGCNQVATDPNTTAAVLLLLALCALAVVLLRKRQQRSSSTQAASDGQPVYTHQEKNAF